MEITPHRYNIPKFSCKTRVFFRDCQWAVFTIWETSTNRIIQEMSDDGTNIYLVSRIEKLENNWMWTDVPNSWVGSIHRSGFPRFALQTVEEILFYAYTSTCYLNSVSNGFVDPIKFEPDDLFEGDKRVKAEIKYSNGSIRLPQEIYFSPRRLGETNIILRVNTITNIGKLQIPLELSLTRFASDDWKPLIDYSFKLISAAPSCSLESFKPSISSTALVSDYRFSHGQAYVPPIVEFATNSWVSEAAAKSQSDYKSTQLDWEEIQKQGSQKLTPRSSHVLVVRIILLATVLGFVAFGVLYRIKSGNKRYVA